MKTLSILALAFIATITFSGCSGSRYYQKASPDNTQVTFDVTLDREFVKSNSTLGGGQAAMLILVGPFTNNKVFLASTRKTNNGSELDFTQNLSWGSTSFKTHLKKNTTYELMAKCKGTRSGKMSVGSLRVGSAPTQKVKVQLLGNKITIN